MILYCKLTQTLTSNLGQKFLWTCLDDQVDPISDFQRTSVMMMLQLWNGVAQVSCKISIPNFAQQVFVMLSVNSRILTTVVPGVPLMDGAKRFVHSISAILCWFLPCNIPTLPTMEARFIPRVALLAADIPAEFHSDRPTFDLAIWFLEHRTHAYTSLPIVRPWGPVGAQFEARVQRTGLELGPDYWPISIGYRS